MWIDLGTFEVFILSFYYEGGKPQVIRFKDQEKIVWAKDKKENL